jgi:glutathione S-transferase
MLRLVIGNKNYSSWSLRPWLALRAAGIPFEEEVVLLDRPDTAERLARLSPSGRVPVLLDGDLVVWDSLAICEYAAERFPERRLWPADARVRAVARSACAEMHSGFQALRERLPVNIRASRPEVGLTPPVEADVARLVQLWTDCRERFGAGGPFLFGPFSIADAFFAPVVTRFRTYGVPLDGEAARWAEAVLAVPAMQEWVAAARAEKESVARYDRRST